MRTALFVGTFDPFTRGHLSVARRALALADRLVIGVGVNERKAAATTEADQRVDAIRQLFSGDGRVEVQAFDGLTVDLAAACGADFIVKGVRSVRDFEYEREQADVNRQLSGIETVLLLAEPGMESLSSTLVRELQARGRDVSRFLP